MEKKFLLNFFRVITSIIFPLITLPYVTRALQPSGFGKVDFANSIIAIFIMFSTLGIPTYGVRLVAQNRHDSIKLSQNVKQLLMLQILGVIICYVVFFICLFLYSKMANEKLLFLILSLSILMNGVGIDWFFSGMEEYGYITLRNGIIQILSFCMILLLIKTPSDYIIYAGITVFSSVGINVLNLFHLRNRISWSGKFTANVLPHIKGSIVFFVLILIGTSLTKLESIMIGSFMNYQDVGIYAAANKIIQCVIGVFTGIGMTFLPTLICLKNDDILKFNIVLEKSVDFIYFVTLPTCVILFILAPQIIDLVVGHKFYLSVTPFRILVAIIFITSLNVVVGNQVFIAFHKESYGAFPILTLAILSPLLNYMLIHYFGVSGASTALLLTSIISAIIQLYLAMKINRIRLFRKHHLKYILASILMAFIVLYCINLNIPLLAIIVISMIGYGLVLIAMREYFVIMYVERVLLFIKTKLMSNN